jgi:hypothetical protein
MNKRKRRPSVLDVPKSPANSSPTRNEVEGSIKPVMVQGGRHTVLTRPLQPRRPMKTGSLQTFIRSRWTRLEKRVLHAGTH